MKMEIHNLKLSHLYLWMICMLLFIHFIHLFLRRMLILFIINFRVSNRNLIFNASAEK